MLMNVHNILICNNINTIFLSNKKNNMLSYSCCILYCNVTYFSLFFAILEYLLMSYNL